MSVFILEMCQVLEWPGAGDCFFSAFQVQQPDLGQGFCSVQNHLLVIVFFHDELLKYIYIMGKRPVQPYVELGIYFISSGNCTAYRPHGHKLWAES